VPLAVQKELLHHSDIQTAMNIYTQEVSAVKRQAAEKVQSILIGKGRVEVLGTMGTRRSADSA
jgi:hypothetical protein